jgi:5-methylcytosine-specific restriction endonuclease McrA
MLAETKKILDRIQIESINQKVYDLPLKSNIYLAKIKGKNRNGSRLKSKRRRMWEKDPNCTYCSSSLKYNEATIDHITPKSKGGSNAMENLCIACQPCNSKKADNIIK